MSTGGWSEPQWQELPEAGSALSGVWSGSGSGSGSVTEPCRSERITCSQTDPKTVLQDLFSSFLWASGVTRETPEPAASLTGRPSLPLLSYHWLERCSCAAPPFLSPLSAQPRRRLPGCCSRPVRLRWSSVSFVFVFWAADEEEDAPPDPGQWKRGAFLCSSPPAVGSSGLLHVSPAASSSRNNPVHLLFLSTPKLFPNLIKVIFDP